MFTPFIRGTCLILVSLLLATFPIPISAATVIFLTSGTSFSTPSDWTTTNSIECVGAGYEGNNATIGLGGSGGGGGAYAKISNLAISGSITYAIGAESTHQDTYFNGAASTTASISCASGRAPVGASGGAGGKTTDSTGTVKFAGGSGAGRSSGTGGAGGGAAGLNGAGVDAAGQSGGNGDAGAGGAGGVGTAADGGNGAEWNYGFVAGSGGGGGGADPLASANGGVGGFYGAGGGGGGTDGAEPGLGAAGTQGIIVVTYWPTLSSMIKIFGGKVLIQGGQTQIY